MAYSQRAPQGDLQRLPYNNRAASYERTPVHGSGNSQGGYGYGRGYDNRDRQRPEHHQNNYGSQHSYDGNGQFRWDDQSGHCTNGGHEGYDNHPWKRPMERPYAQQSRQRPMRPQRNGYENAGRHGSPNPMPRPLNNMAYQQDDRDLSSNAYRDEESYQDWNGGSHSYQYSSEEHAVNGYQGRPLGNQAVNHSQPSEPQPHDYRAQQDHDEDTLPRYLNGGSRGTPQQRPPDANHQAHYGVRGGIHPSHPPQHHSVLNTINVNGSTLPSRPKPTNDRLESPETLAWDNPFPTFPPKVNHSQANISYNGVDDDQLRPHIVQGRQSEDIPTRPGVPPSLPPTSGYERSRTMPAAISRSIPDSGLIPVDQPPSYQEPGAVSGYYGPEDKGYLPNEHDQLAPSRPRLPPKSRSDGNRWGTKDASKPVQSYSTRQGLVPEAGHGEIFDSYNEEPSNPSQKDPIQKQGRNRRSPYDEEMPDFGAGIVEPSRQRGMTLDKHLQTQSGEHERRPPISSHRDRYDRTQVRVDDYATGNLPRSQSQPKYNECQPPISQEHEGFDFGVPGPPERRPATSAAPNDHGVYNSRPPGEFQYAQNFRQGPHTGPGSRLGPENRDFGQHSGLGSRRIGQEPVQVDRIVSPPMRNGRSPSDRMQRPPNRPPPSNLTAPAPPPQKPLPNPDALPKHPAPVRPGLVSGATSGQAARPAPVRQYNAAPIDSTPQPAASRSAEGRSMTGPVTPQELEGLKQKTLSRPNDSATQFLLAKKLVEAADVLIDERADPGTKKRNRDKYQSDALKIIKKLSALSYAEADFYYADCYSRGALGVQPDIKEAFLLYQKAAKANHAQAAYRVAVCCELGQEEGGGTKRDAVKAMQWYKRAATLGDVAAMYKMGVIQLKGLLGQAKDPRDAVTWLKRAAGSADKENPHALHELALLHEKPTGLEGIRQDEAYSRTLFTQAANLGYKFSQFRLGCAYEYGLLGCPVEPRQSIAWYSKAAVQEEHQSELALSGWYLTGSEGVLQQSDTEAYLWARKAAQAGLAKAEYAMGYFTEVGIGAPANLEDAKRWYWKSASQNFPKARDRLEDLRKGGGPKQKARVSRSNMRKQSDGECVVM